MALNRPHSFSHDRSRRGFSFAEVLFAIMILAIGFIMIAAVFPVALQQTKLTGEEIVASTVARGSANYAEQIAVVPPDKTLPTNLLHALPITINESIAPPAYPLYAIPPAVAGVPGQRSVQGQVYSFRDSRIPDPDGTGTVFTALDEQLKLWKRVNGNLILPSDNRSANIMLYRRGATYINPTAGALAHTSAAILRKLDPYVQIFVIGVQARNRSTFDFARDARRQPTETSAAPAALEPRAVFVNLTEGNLAADQLTFHVNGATNAAIFDEPMAVEGAFVIISDDRFTHVNPADADQDTTTAVIEQNGQSNGRIYRLGSKVGAGTWELTPGWDMKYSNRDNVVGSDDDIHENIPPRAVGTAATGLPAFAFIVGRGYSDPLSPYIDAVTPGAGFEGPAQETGIYTTYIQAN